MKTLSSSFRDSITSLAPKFPFVVSLGSSIRVAVKSKAEARRVANRLLAKHPRLYSGYVRATNDGFAVANFWRTRSTGRARFESQTLDRF